MNIAVVVLIVVVVPFAVYGAGSLAWSAFWAGSDSGLDAPDCGEFQFDAGAWSDPSGDERAEQANGLAHCHLLVGMDRQEVDDMIGAAASTKNGFAAFALPPSNGGERRRLFVRFRQGEVTRVEYYDSSVAAYD